MSLLKREIKGYLVLFLSTGYEKIPYVRVGIGTNIPNLVEWKGYDNYWFQNKKKRTIPLYKKDIKKLKKYGYEIPQNMYYRELGYDEWLEYSKRKIINRIIEKR